MAVHSENRYAEEKLDFTDADFPGRRDWHSLRAGTREGTTAGADLRNHPRENRLARQLAN